MAFFIGGTQWADNSAIVAWSRIVGKGSLCENVVISGSGTVQVYVDQATTPTWIYFTKT
jgi:hypothetical protein